MNVLIVEDDLNRMVQFRQNLIGTSVKFVWSVKDAITEIQTGKYDVIFLDYDLDLRGEPRKSIEAVLHVRNCQKCMKRPIWIVHSLNEQGGADLMQALKPTARGILRAPWAWQHDDLKEQIEKLHRSFTAGPFKRAG
jgi:CheY-like chemotaxis protein